MNLIKQKNIRIIFARQNSNFDRLLFYQSFFVRQLYKQVKNLNALLKKLPQCMIIITV